MHALLVVALFLAQAPDPVDVSSVKAKLKAWTDGHGHYIVTNPEHPYGETFFSGDGKKFYRNRVFGGGRTGDQDWTVRFWEPRADRQAMFEMRDEGKVYELNCGTKGVNFEMTPVPEEELKGMLDSAAFLGFLWTRLPEMLMRDEAGNYFFVDRLRTEGRNDRRDFRVFKGPRGKMKLLPLKDIVDDSQGTIFATKDGTLRLISNQGKGQVLKWVVGKTETTLTEVPVDDNVRMIYLDLGPYAGVPLGTACDGLL